MHSQRRKYTASTFLEDMREVELFEVMYPELYAQMKQPNTMQGHVEEMVKLKYKHKLGV